MKETRYFFAPNASQTDELPSEEAQHAVRVLRMAEGDAMVLMDGQGTFYDAEVTLATPRRCLYRILAKRPQPRQWQRRIHLAMAPTKHMERTEWALEKATEIGVDSITLLNCQWSERRVANLERLDKIVVAATKQSRKAWKPILRGIVPFADFIAEPRQGVAYMAHCRDEAPRTWLFDELRNNQSTDVTILIGPEGDFSAQELQAAMDANCQSVHLGESRLRTETAAIMAVAMAQLAK